MRRPQRPVTLLDRLRGWLEAPQAIERLELVRIVAPLVLLAFLSSRLVHADHWLRPIGFRVPYLGGHDWRQPLYLPPFPPALAWIIAVLTALAGLCLSEGLFTRVAAGAFA